MSRSSVPPTLAPKLENSMRLGSPQARHVALRAPCPSTVDRDRRLGGAGAHRVAHVVHSLNLGGAERLAARMALALKGTHETSIICLDEPGLWAAELRTQGVPVHAFWRQPGTDLNLAHRLARFAGHEGIELLHAHQYAAWFYCGLSRYLKRGPKLLFQEHGRFFPEIRSRKRELFNRLVLQPKTDCIVAVSEDVKERLIRFEALPEHQVEVIRNGTDDLREEMATARQRVRSELGLKENELLVGTIGRFDPVKNLPMLLDAVGQCRRRKLRLRVLLIGDGPCFQEIRNLVTRLGLADSVLMTGYRADAAKLVGALDVFVLSSLTEGTSMALLESMAAGVPAVVTDVGGNREIVVEGTTGWIVPSNDPASLAASLAEIALDPAEVKRRGQASRQRFVDQFTFSQMMQSYEHLYAGLLGSS